MKTIFEYVINQKIKHTNTDKYNVYEIQKLNGLGVYCAVVIESEEKLDKFISELPKDTFSSTAVNWMKNKLNKRYIACYFAQITIGLDKYEPDGRGLEPDRMNTDAKLIGKISANQFNQKYWKDHGWLK